MILDEEHYLAHYGILRRSGRYPWGSGGTQHERNRTFLDTVAELKRKGLTDTEISKGFDISTTKLRALKSIAKNEQRQAQISMAQRLHNKGLSGVAIGERMGINESSVRALLAPGAKDRADILTTVSKKLKDEVADKKYVMVGRGVEQHLGISKEKLNTAIAILEEKGYKVHTITVPQAATGLNTYVKVLAPPGTTWGEVSRNREQIKLISGYSDDGGRTFAKVHDPLPIDAKRVSIRYKEDGGDKADGVIYVRPGVEDVSLGKGRYAQVRVQVGDRHFLKGMAMYKEDLPEGTDLLFNTKKPRTGNKFDAMKDLETDPDFPFGSIVHQVLAGQGTPHERVVSVMNKVGTKEGSGEEGDWATWSKNLSTQLLSKQNPALARTQLNMTFERSKHDFDEIQSLTNPTIKRKLLETYADSADSSAVSLEAAALSRRQGWHVILPIASISPSQIYAPRFRNGERVVLIRYPHGGTFEIPELTVNNKHREAKSLLGDAEDAIGIHHSVATHLSGADFDGDTVLVIPNNSGRVKHTPMLDGLKNFDPIAEYQHYDGMERMTPERKGVEMGNVTNLITDMTIHLAPHSDIVKAIRHSMVVIDAENHYLNYKLSAINNGIAQLKEKYQGGRRAGASTLISRATSEQRVPHRKLRPASEGGPIDEKGRKVFVETGRTRVTKEGKVVPLEVVSTKLAETHNAHTLSSGTVMEKLYADHSNKLKDLANQARLAAVKTPPLQRSPSAARTYSKEVASLTSKLALAKRNAPLEVQANLITSVNMRALRQNNPHLKKDTIKKLKFRELEKARARVGAKKPQIKIDANEWNAIQAGAISNSMLKDILNNADLDVVRKLATPRRVLLMTTAKTLRAKDMLASGYTRADVADALGVSLTTLDTAIKG